jgi:hypothetical protein
MKSIFIVESENDKFFCERYIRFLNENSFRTDAEVIAPLCSVDDYECMDGLNEAKFIQALNSIQNRSRKEGIGKIGIVIDIDNNTIEEKLSLVNAALSKSNFDVRNNINNVNTFVSVKVDNDIDIQIACYFTNVENRGNLDTLLKNIKKSESDFADCLEAWRGCIGAHKKDIKNSDFDKFWLQVYMRYDQCSAKDQKQAGRKCDFISSLNKDIWSFDAEILNSFRDFITLFQNTDFATT